MAQPGQAKRVAVVGSGISGLGAAWLLHRNGYKVTVFESEERCGGHTLTDDSGPYPVDLGFQVYNLTTYPHLVGMLETLGVDTEPSEMSFALSLDGGRLEWASHGLDSVFAQRSNLASPSFLAMIYDVIRFGKEAPEVLRPETAFKYEGVTLGQYLEDRRYSASFRANYVLPMCAAVWSVPNTQVLEFPVQMLVRFWANHHLLDLTQRPVWRVVKGRSRSYVEAITRELPDVRTSCAVQSVQSLGPQGPVRVVAAACDGASGVGGAEEFDAVLLATHTDISLRLLGGDTAPQDVHEVLAGVPYNDNDVYLHSDASLMPVNRKAWASWNLLGSTGKDSDKASVCVTYWLNRLQHLPPEAPDMFVTLNPLHPPAEGSVWRRLTLAHPVYGFEAIEAQRKLPGIQGQGGVYYAGAWTGYGFHEDGLRSAIDVVQRMGCTPLPWTPRSTSPKAGLLDWLCMRMFDSFACSGIRRGYLRMVLPNGEELRYGNPDDVVPGSHNGGEDWRGLPPLCATLRIFDLSFFRKLISRHDTGLGESYMDGDWEVDDLGGLMAVLTANAVNIEGNRGALGVINWLGDRLLHLAHLRRANTIEGSRRNIEEHYDAGNDMYRLFLDESMTYSSGIHAPGDNLHQAQLRKLDALISKAGIKADHHVLEIGCGWGSFSIRAAQTTGCRVTGVTVSREQLNEARARVKAAGLQNRVNLIFCDYREIPGAGTFDCVVSCEMIEAVGHENLPTYFGAIGRMLKPGGVAVIQAISEPDDRYETYCNSSDFIREHIFPGGHLPCISAMVGAASQAGSGLHMVATDDIGPDYAITLRGWRRRWEERKDEVLALGYSDRFWRKYRFYFAYCEAAFDARYIHNFQITWTKITDSDAAAAPDPMPAATDAKPMQQQRQGGGSDPVTQVLLAVYFFLAGIAVSNSPLLWLTPCCSAICAALEAAAAPLSALAVRPYGAWDWQQRAQWRNTLVQASYSAIMCCLVTVYLTAATSSGLLLGTGMGLGVVTPLVLSRGCLCIAAGFCGYELWALVHHRLFYASPAAVVHHTALLLLYGCAAYKATGAALLTLCLVGEAHALVVAVRRLAGQLQNSSSRIVGYMLETSVFVCCRLLPQLFALYQIMIAGFTLAGASPLYRGILLGGLLYLNGLNTVTLVRKFEKGSGSVRQSAARTNGKAHAS